MIAVVPDFSGPVALLGGRVPVTAKTSPRLVPAERQPVGPNENGAKNTLLFRVLQKKGLGNIVQFQV